MNKKACSYSTGFKWLTYSDSVLGSDTECRGVSNILGTIHKALETQVNVKKWRQLHTHLDCVSFAYFCNMLFCHLCLVQGLYLRNIPADLGKLKSEVE